MKFFSFRKIYILIIALVIIISFIFVEAKNLSGFTILISNHFLFLPILLSIGLIITFYLVYQKKIAIEEIEEKLKKYREKRGIKYEMGEMEPSDFTGLYYSQERKVVVYSTFPHPLPGYETEGIRAIKEKFPKYWKEIEELLLKAIKELYSQKEAQKGMSKILKKIMKIFKNKNEEDELYSRFNKLRREIERELKDEREKYESLIILNRFVDKLLGYLASIHREVTDIVHPNVLLPPEEAKKNISLLLQEMHRHPLYYLPEKFKKLPLTIEKAMCSSLFSPQGEKYIYDLYMMKKELEEEIEKVRSFLQIDRELERIAGFLSTSPESKLKDISKHIFIEAHETGHGIFHSFFKEEEKETFYSTGLFEFFDEGFADAFTLYYTAKQVEKGYLPLDVLKLVASRQKIPLEYVIGMPKSEKGVKSYLDYVVKSYIPYAVGDKIFRLDEIWKEIEKLSPEELSPEEYRKKVREIRRMIGNRIEYVSGVIKSTIPFEEKYKRLKEIKEEAYKNIFGSRVEEY